jgi:transcriptional regulator with XRE-family HTH domain
MSPDSAAITAQERAARVARELLCALRGRRSKPAFSRRLGYASNIAQRWEAAVSWPAAPRFFAVCERVGLDVRAAMSRFLRRDPAFLREPGLTLPGGVAALLADLRGKTPIRELAERSGYNRFSISRWLKGAASPRLPELLCLVEACTRRLPDFVAELVDPERLPSLAEEWRALQRAREGVYTRPLSHAVLRALELPAPASAAAQVALVARRTGLSVEQVASELEFLHAAGQIGKTRRGFRHLGKNVVDTGGQAQRALELKLTWSRLALERLAAGAPGHVGYSLFSVSRADLRRIRQLQLEYVRALSAIVANSHRSECVGLYAAQLLDLADAEDNVFAGHELPAPAVPSPRAAPRGP